MRLNRGLRYQIKALLGCRAFAENRRKPAGNLPGRAFQGTEAQRGQGKVRPGQGRQEGGKAATQGPRPLQVQRQNLGGNGGHDPGRPLARTGCRPQGLGGEGVSQRSHDLSPRQGHCRAQDAPQARQETLPQAGTAEGQARLHRGPHTDCAQARRGRHEEPFRRL